MVGKYIMSANNKKPNVVMLVSHPIQYYVPIYRAMSESDAIRFSVIFEHGLVWGSHLIPVSGRAFLGIYHYWKATSIAFYPISQI